MYISANNKKRNTNTPGEPPAEVWELQIKSKSDKLY